MTVEEKLELVKSRFEDIEEDDLMDGDEFFAPPRWQWRINWPLPAKRANFNAEARTSAHLHFNKGFEIRLHRTLK